MAAASEASNRAMLYRRDAKVKNIRRAQGARDAVMEWLDTAWCPAKRGRSGC